MYKLKEGDKVRFIHDYNGHKEYHKEYCIFLNGELLYEDLEDFWQKDTKTDEDIRANIAYGWEFQIIKSVNRNWEEHKQRMISGKV